ncbi:DUF397 domain-containing protein [Streptomyces sp. MW-W600-10]|uniref:DUF397 domain-containing protein n=1 Tax=Streptomyces sp. MW-W600-10 TaxID=2829819 RepID=UPI001C46FFC9|nr:DUF397 domain-containing protein [Streptomyces sp. MW-W600-10]MBV7243156.1 DUF397 domain-containing protein [Streptomyces sp. MW-W600-10]
MSNSHSPLGTSDLKWFKNSYSGTGGGECVEVASADSAVYARDSKRERGPVLSVAAGERAEFVTFASGRGARAV